MNLYKEILIEILKNEEIKISFPNININASELIGIESYKALKNIKAIIEDDSLDDRECFMKIEEIILVYENLGSGCGNRHDF